MLLTITTTHQPATDLGYLLHKNPARVAEFELPVGRGHVFYPEATPERCTVALLVEADPIVISRGKHGSSTPLEPYVNDRPYAASSYLSTAMRETFGTAMTGRSKERQDLADRALPFTARVSALPSRGGLDLAERLFAPLGYAVTAQARPLDDHQPEWGASPYLDLTVSSAVRLRDLLAHLYVLIPVLDDSKHYYVSEAEIDKLLRHAGAWLDTHPERELITRRFLKHRRALQRAASEHFGTDDEDDEPTPRAPTLNQQRLDAVAHALKESGATSVLDLGCGEGNLLRLLLQDRQFERILGMDVSARVLARAQRNLCLDELPSAVRARLTLMQGSLTYRDARLAGFDAAALVEVIEHLDEPRLWTLERVVFAHARPGTVVVTTPNAEYNATWATLPAGHVRHDDHRFEWTRAEFHAWARHVAETHAYAVTFHDIGDANEHLGAPTQMAVFTRGNA